MTEILVTFVCGGESKDLVIPVVDGTGRDLYRAVADRFGDHFAGSMTIERTGTELTPDSALESIGLFDGDRIIVGWTGRAGTSRAIAGPRLTVTEGPDSGRVIVLQAGRTTVGRGADSSTRVGLDDATVSRNHAEIDVDDLAVVVRDLGSRNGTELNGAPLEGSVSLRSGDVLGFGDTVLEVDLGSVNGATRHLSPGLGRIMFNREPRVVTADPAVTVELPVPPATPPRRRFPLPAAVVPVVMGVVIYLVMGNPIFLLMAGMGPLMVIWTTIDDRRSGRRDFAHAVERFHRGVASVRETLERTREQRRDWLEGQHPPSSELVGRARDHSSLLWRRRSRDVDFGSLRLGTADLVSPSKVTTHPTENDELRPVLDGVIAEFELEPGVPLVVSLVQRRVIGIVQTEDRLSDVVRACIAQLVTDQSPKDMGLAILAPQHSDDWEFAKWLPHVRAFGDEFRMIAHGDPQAKVLFDSLVKLVEQRSNAAEESIGGGAGLFSPHLVVVVHPPAKLSRREVTEFLERAPSVGISVIWIATDRTTLPGECTAVIEVGRHDVAVTFTDTGETRSSRQAEHVDPVTMEAVARALAPLEDVSAGSDAAIPNRIDLLELMGLPQIEAPDVVARWREQIGGLRAVIGADEDGPVEVDWRVDGPHALVAGTTGAGKSELLQSLVASMAVVYPPSRLNFVLVDYKGGAAFKDCADLPHTVGMVTDLDGHLATRALISLAAELHHRERLLKSVRAKDIIEMTAKSPSTAPPNLLIIIDEFAALKNEVPDFVDGVIDIAQRGRSLGVHLLLATQQPNGVIDPKIQGNTNLRIALRVADSSDSVDVIGRPHAHEISKSLPGRGYVRTGPSDVDEFQSAYVGGTGADTQDVAAATFHFGLEDRADLPRALEDRTARITDLQRIVAAVRGAFEQQALPTPRRPWVEPLPSEVRYSSLVGAPAPGVFGAIIGVADHPAEQTQRPFGIDLDEQANVVVFGSSGSGKTTFLRTLAMDLALRNTADQLWLYALDYGSRGLSVLQELAHCGGVVLSDDLNRTRRLVETLRREVNARQQLFSESNTSGPVEYREATGRSVPRIVVLIDGFGSLWETLDGVDRSEHLATLIGLFADGRSAGLHFVVTADRRNALPPTVAAHISARFMMRMADRDEYVSFGVRSLAEAAQPVDGRAFTETGSELQVAVLHFDDGVAAASQNRVLSELARHVAAPARPVPKVELLPEFVALAGLGAPQRGRVPIGLDETTLEPVFVDLDDNPVFAVFGPDRSGKSTAVATLGLGLAEYAGSCFLLAGRRTPLADLGIWEMDGIAIGVEQAEQLTARLQEFARHRADSGFDRPMLVVLDDGDAFGEGRAAGAIEQLVLRARDAGVIVLVSMTTFAGHKSYATWIRAARSNRHGVILQPDLEDDGDLFGVRLPQRSGLLMPVGRGILSTRAGLSVLQVASAQ